MQFRPSLGELVVIGSAITAEIFIVKAHSKRSSSVVCLFNLSVPLRPLLWVQVARLRYLSQSQAAYFFREE